MEKQLVTILIDERCGWYSELPTSPTCTPTQNPYPPTNIHMFYPDWSAEGFDQGCLNDGKEPAYMLANPSAWLHSTLRKCCETHFTWNYETCMGLLDESYAHELWYPDWERANTGCVSDGNEPLYMIEPANKHLYLFNTRKDCCEKHYSWNFNECMNIIPSSGGKFYPDWSVGANHGCKNDGNAPAYMIMSPNIWLHPTLDSCCASYFPWKLNECLAVASAAFSAGAESYKWYMDWTLGKCVKDCMNGNGCSGLAHSWDDLYNTQTSCCKEKNWWNAKCSDQED
ncbi:hypothetical protein ACHAW6_004371 [Cyclotella cf. meneghiniana]